MSETYYKVLNADGSAFHGGSGKWFLPNGRPGKWMPKIADPKPCVRGYHILKPDMLMDWLGPAIFEVEVRGAEIWQDNKGVVAQARLVKRLDAWNEQTARLFASDCAEKVVHLVKDERSVNAIRVARRFAFGLSTKDELAAAMDAAWDAARAAAWAAQTKRLFEYLNGQVDLEAIKAAVR